MADGFELETYKVKQLPDSVYYIPEFISEAEESSLLQSVYSAPKPKWTQLSNRRLQNWGGLPHPKGMVEEKVPEWLDAQCRKVSCLGIFDGKAPNHVLINEYLPGQGIMPHTDGPLYFPAVSNITLSSHTVLDFYDSLGSIDASSEKNSAEDMFERSAADQRDESTCLEKRFHGSVLLQRRALVLLVDRAYSFLLHGIRETESDLIDERIFNLDRCADVKLGETLARQTRVSLTIRHVPRVLKSKLFFGNKK